MERLFSKTLSIKINIFIAALMAIFLFIVMGAVYIDAKNHYAQKKQQSMAVADSIFESNMDFEKTSLLQTLIAVKNNTEYLKAFKEGDRQRLLAVTESFFGELKSKHNITHFYFITPDKKCFLRVHKPEQYGDTIERATLTKAIEKQGEFVSLEMGKNFFSLRAVTPVFYKGELLGYMEIGREIDDFFPLFKKQTGFDISLLLDNEYIEKYKRTTGTQLVPDGNSVGGFLILNSSNPKLTDLIVRDINIKETAVGSFNDFWIEDRAYSCYSKELCDASGEAVGRLFVSFDNTELHDAVNKQYIFILALTLLVAISMAYGIRIAVKKEVLKPIEKIRNGVMNFFNFIRGDTKTIRYIEPMENNEIGSIGNMLNENMEETIQILEENKKNEAYLLQRSRVIALGEMISNIAHHWRQPLNIIAVSAQDIRYTKDEGELTDEYLESTIKKIVDTTKSLSATLNKFGHFYRQPKNKESFCVEEEVGKSIEFFKEINVESTVDIKFEPELHHTIKNHKSELSQAVLNILKNSYEAITKQNIQNGEIAVSVSASGKSVKIAISDNGGGVDAKKIDNIFDPYFTTKYKSNDVGLGLYLSKMMIEKNMGGVLTAQNDKDGLKIVIELPLSKED